MKRIYDKYEMDDCLVLFLYIIDLKRDIVVCLKKYVEGLGVEVFKWYFVMGEKDKIYDIVQDYMSIVCEDENVFGGFDYSGWLFFIDKDFYIWFFCNGMEVEVVDQFMKDIDFFLEEM